MNERRDIHSRVRACREQTEAYFDLDYSDTSLALPPQGRNTGTVTPLLFCSYVILGGGEKSHHGLYILYSVTYFKV